MQYITVAFRLRLDAVSGIRRGMRGEREGGDEGEDGGEERGWREREEGKGGRKEWSGVEGENMEEEREEEEVRGVVGLGECMK